MSMNLPTVVLYSLEILMSNEFKSLLGFVCVVCREVPGGTVHAWGGEGLGKGLLDYLHEWIRPSQ